MLKRVNSMTKNQKKINYNALSGILGFICFGCGDSLL